MSSPHEKFLQVQILMGNLKEFFSRNPNLFTHTGAKVAFMWFERLSGSEEAISTRTFTSAYLYMNMLRDAMNFSRSYVYQKAHEMCLEGKNHAVCTELVNTIRQIDYVNSGIDDTKIAENCLPVYQRNNGSLDRCMDSWKLLFDALRDKITNLEVLLKELMGSTWSAERKQIEERGRDFVYGRATRDALFVAESAHKEVFTFVNDLAHSDRVIYGEVMERVGSIQSEFLQLKTNLDQKADELAARVENIIPSVRSEFEVSLDTNRQQLATLKAEVLELRRMREEEGKTRVELESRMKALTVRSANIPDSMRDELQRAMTMPLSDLKKEVATLASTTSSLLSEILQIREAVEIGGQSITSLQSRIDALNAQMEALSSSEQTRVLSAMRQPLDDLRADVDRVKIQITSSADAQKAEIERFESDVKAAMKKCNEQVVHNLQKLTQHVDIAIADIRREQSDLRSNMVKDGEMTSVRESVKQIESSTARTALGMQGMVTQDQYRQMMEQFKTLEHQFIQQGDDSRARIVHLEKNLFRYQLLLLGIFILTVLFALSPLPMQEFTS